MRGRVLGDGVGVFITVDCRSKFIMNAEVWVFLGVFFEYACAITEEHRAT